MTRLLTWRYDNKRWTEVDDHPVGEWGSEEYGNREWDDNLRQLGFTETWANGEPLENVWHRNVEGDPEFVVDADLGDVGVQTITTVGFPNLLWLLGELRAAGLRS